MFRCEKKMDETKKNVILPKSNGIDDDNDDNIDDDDNSKIRSTNK